MNRYRNLLPLLVNGEYGQGDEFELELSDEEEASHLAAGLLEIVPRDYKVVGDSRVWDTDPGDTFTRALTLGEERHLVDGGFIERVAEKPARKPRAPKK